MSRKKEDSSSKDKYSACEQQLRAANQQLQASEQQLRAANQQLQANAEEIRNLNHNLQNRVKELECLYGLSRLDEKRDVSLETILDGAVELIPAGWQYPEVAGARVSLGKLLFKSKNFCETAWMQSANIKEDGEKAGTIEICYSEKKPILDEGPFLKEERELLDVLARRLGHITERKKAELERSIAYNALHSSVNGVAITDVEGVIMYANPAALRMFKYETVDEVKGKHASEMFVTDSVQKFSDVTAIIDRAKGETEEFPVRKKDGAEFYVEASSSVVTDEKGEVAGRMASFVDITRRKQAEQEVRAAHQQLQASEQQLRASNQQLAADEQQLRAANQQLQASEQQLRADHQQLTADEQQLKAANQQLQASEQQLRAANQQLQAEVNERKKAENKIKASLQEKEVLLKEIHHRVKNNMQVISSILNLQSRYIKDREALEIFRESQRRIKAMALVHEKLYGAEDLAGIDFAEYTRSMTSNLFVLYKISEAVRLNIDIKDILLDINTAIPCALIISELVSNSLKYAFPEGIEGEIGIGLYTDKNGKFKLIVKDNGIGISKEIDFRKTETLGMQLVIMLVEELAGTIELDKSEGTAFTIQFKKP